MLVTLFVIAICVATGAGFFGLLNVVLGNGLLAASLIALAIVGVGVSIHFGTAYNQQLTDRCTSVEGQRVDSACFIVHDGRLLEVEP